MALQLDFVHFIIEKHARNTTFRRLALSAGKEMWEGETEPTH